MSSVTVVEKDTPDSLGVRASKSIAGSAIRDHFQDVVLPTLELALEKGRHEIASQVEGSIRERVDAVATNELERLVEKAILSKTRGTPESYIEIFDQATQRSTLMPRQHYMFPVVLKLLTTTDANRNPLNLALVGPAGNGKTSLALSAAEALGTDVVLQPFNPQTTKSELMGYMDAGGRYVESPFYKAFKEGRLYIADEFDAANPSVGVILNAAVANRRITFPNGETLKASPNFRAVFIMNTYGTGGDHQYTGRLRQDAATLDRLVYVQLPIDPQLEAKMAGLKVQDTTKVNIEEGGRFSEPEEILDMVRAVRKASNSLGISNIVSPRATLYACAMHEAGFGRTWIMNSCIWRGMNETDRANIREKAGLRHAV